MYLANFVNIIAPVVSDMLRLYTRCTNVCYLWLKMCTLKGEVDGFYASHQLPIDVKFVLQ